MCIFHQPLGVQVARPCKHANKLSVDSCDAVAGIGAKAAANLSHGRNGTWNISKDLISNGPSIILIYG